MILYLAVNQVDVCHNNIYGPLTGDTKYILWIDDCLLGISKTSYIGYNMKSSKMIIWSRCDRSPLIF